MNYARTAKDKPMTGNDSLEQLSSHGAIELPVLRPVVPQQVNSFRKTHVSGSTEHVGHRSDDEYLVRLGKKPLLKREFGFMSMLGFSCSALLTWEGILVNTVVALLNGGPAGVVWGFFINCKFHFFLHYRQFSQLPPRLSPCFPRFERVLSRGTCIDNRETRDGHDVCQRMPRRVIFHCPHCGRTM